MNDNTANVIAGQMRRWNDSSDAPGYEFFVVDVQTPTNAQKEMEKGYKEGTDLSPFLARFLNPTEATVFITKASSKTRIAVMSSKLDDVVQNSTLVTDPEETYTLLKPILRAGVKGGQQRNPQKNIDLFKKAYPGFEITDTKW